MTTKHRPPARVSPTPIIPGLLVMLMAVGCSAASGEEIAARLDALLVERYPADEPGAAVRVLHGSETILDRGYGMANLEHGISVGPETVFRLASVTKVFVSTAALMLVEDGKLSLEDDLRKHLPGFPQGRGTLTVGQLLGHTTGLADYLDRPDTMRWVRGEQTVEQLIDSFKDRSRSFAPGERGAYCNSNYVLLGAVLEKVSGVELDELLRRRIFDPLGMRQTYYDVNREIIPGRAAAYEPLRLDDERQDWDHFLNVRFYTMSALYAAGGYHSTVGDLQRFHDALFGGKLIREETVRLSLEPMTLNDGTPTTISRGGWQIDSVGGRPALMKGGALPGVCTWYATLPEDRITVILLSNRSAGEPRCGRLSVQLLELASGG